MNELCRLCGCAGVAASVNVNVPVACLIVSALISVSVWFLVWVCLFVDGGCHPPIFLFKVVDCNFFVCLGRAAVIATGNIPT